MDWLADPQAWIALATLTALELVLGIDNIVFISILAGRLPQAERPKARKIGMAMAMGTRILLLLSLSWIMKLTAPLFGILGHQVSGRDLILLTGGLFLLFKATREIHERLEGEEGSAAAGARASFVRVVIQIAILDLVFSLDSVITAVGMVDRIGIMISAVVLSVALMLLFSNSVAGFVERHPTVKMLALSFLLLIGVTLLADGLHFHIPKGYVYFSMAFSLFVEILNLRMRKKAKPVKLHNPGP